jgi:hypothetical protein
VREGSSSIKSTPSKEARMRQHANTQTKQQKPKNETNPERTVAKELKDLDVDPAKADKVRGGPMRCTNPNGC